MHQLQIHLKNHLQAYCLNFTDGEQAKMHFDIVLKRRKEKLSDIIAIGDDIGGIIAIDCTEVSTHLIVNTDNLLRINVRNNIDAQILGNEAAMRANSKPRIEKPTGFLA